MIQPTNGRIVLFTPLRDPAREQVYGKSTIVQHDEKQPLAAQIVHVWNDRMVNLVVFDSEGTPHQQTSVTLLQDADAKSEHGRYAEWMPYQKGQAAKTEALEQQIGGTR